MSNPWDELSSSLDTTKDESKISSRFADNILIAWPVILNYIQQYAPKEKNPHLLEYGCGAGSFANKLSNLGYQVAGIDSSRQLIKIAKAAYGKNVNFICGDSSDISTQSRFSIITSVMTFQFIKNIEKTFNDINNALVSGGIFAFAVHNPQLIKTYLSRGKFFEDFDSLENPKKGILN